MLMFNFEILSEKCSFELSRKDVKLLALVFIMQLKSIRYFESTFGQLERFWQATTKLPLGLARTLKKDFKPSNGLSKCCSQIFKKNSQLTSLSVPIFMISFVPYNFFLFIYFNLLHRYLSTGHKTLESLSVPAWQKNL